MEKDLLRYDHMVEAALRGVVRETIARVSGFGLPGGHSLYITFRSEFPGVQMPDWLKAQYPEAMTIVLEHQFWDLAAEEETFGVTLSFKGRRQRIVVPYAALTAFHDPGVQFGLRFDQSQEGEEKVAAPGAKSLSAGLAVPAPSAAPAAVPAQSTAEPTAPEPPKTAQVVSLESFRKK
ncbi:MAG: SspB family protein [Alphaproteobacteria bacterium]